MRRTSIMVCPKQGVPRKSQGCARDFWGGGETVLQRLRIAFWQAATTQMLFRRGGAEENPVISRKARVMGFSSNHGKKFCQLKTFFVNHPTPDTAPYPIQLSVRAWFDSVRIPKDRHRTFVPRGACALRRKVLRFARTRTDARYNALSFSAFRAGVVLA